MLCRNFEGSAFAAATFNLGPRVCTSVHRDHLNLPGGFCSITALGSYNPTQGGHLILWDLNLIIEFPPGTTILVASAVIAHSNLPVSGGETRMSFTQYSAGALFRYVDDGFRLRKNLAPVEKEARSDADGRRAHRAWEGFPTLE